MEKKVHHADAASTSGQQDAELSGHQGKHQQVIADMSKILIRLDELSLHVAAAHLSQAIESVPNDD